MHYIGLEAHALTSKQTTNESGAVRYGLSSFQVRNHEGARHCRKPLGRRSVTKGPIYRFFELVTSAVFNCTKSQNMKLRIELSTFFGQWK